MARQIKAAPAAAATALALSVAACGHNPMSTYSWGGRHYANLSERDCMARAMYFESNRSSEEGMKAVGTVVMNRVRSGQYSSNICAVVGAPRQFAPGVLSKPVGGSSWALAQRSADAVIAGERHARVGRAMHFHTAGYTFPYRNMAYVVAAGGNVFYEKRTPGSFTPVHPNVLVAEAQRRPVRPSEQIVLARAEAPEPQVEPVRLASLAEREPPRAMRPEPRPVFARRDEDGTDARSEHGRRPFARQIARDDDEAPRPRARPERIRLAHLDDDDLPRALHQRSDAAPTGRFGGIALPQKTIRAASELPKGQPPQKGQPAASAGRSGTTASGKAEAARATAGRPIGPATVAKADARAEPGRSGAASAPARVATAKPGASKPMAAMVPPARPVAKPEPVPVRKVQEAGLRPSPSKPHGEPLAYRDAKAKPGPDALAKAGWHRGPEPAIPAGRDKPRKKS